MACVHGLSHLVARSLKVLDLPDLPLATTAYAYLGRLMDLVGDDSAALFDTVVGGKPFAPEVLARFVKAARALVPQGAAGRASVHPGSVDLASTCGAGG